MLAIIIVLLALFVDSAVAKVAYKSEFEARGVILLDAFTFPKLIPSEDLTYVVLVANKGSIGDYGTDSVRADFFSFSDYVQTKDENGSSKKIVFAQIIVNGAENAKLAQRIGVPKNFKHPQMFLFPAGKTSPIPYPKTSPFQLSNLLRFLTQNTAYLYKVPGVLEHYSPLVKSVSALIYKGAGKADPTTTPETTFENHPEYLKLLEEAKTIHETHYATSTEKLPLLHTTTEATSKEAGGKEESTDSLAVKEISNFYLYTLENIAKAGSAHVKKEIDRLKLLFEEPKLLVVARTRVTYELNIVKSFLNSRETLTESEVKKIQNTPGRRDL